MDHPTAFTYVNQPEDESADQEYEKALVRVMSGFGEAHPLWIGKEKVIAGSEFEVRAPFDRNLLIGSFQNCEMEHIDRAISQANDGFETWGRHSWEERVTIAEKIADVLESWKYDLSAIITCESGKPRPEAIAEAREAVDLIRYHCSVYREHNGFISPMQPESENAESTSVMRPYGVFAVISPFNFPLSLATGMACSALLTGNSVILKPASATPLTSLWLYRACIMAGVPHDTVHYLTGPGERFGEVITGHAGIAGIAFTGSRDAGNWINRTFQERQPYKKPVILELGSKNPVIVTGNADVEKAAEGVFKSAYGYCGQKCSATSRVYVQEDVAGQFIDLLRERTEALRVGDPRLKDIFNGPLIDRHAVERYVEAVSLARNDGISVVTGGGVMTGGMYERGYFVQPTILAGVPEDHFLVKNELFIPLVVVNTFSTLPEALRKANNSYYGLTAGIFSEDDEEVAYFFDTIQSGVTYANRRGGATTGAWPGSQPFGGWKASGSTGKGVGGPWYLLSYLREQARTRIR
ncbi:MAG TPA: aldehyde dehydrogenase family protein [Methanoregulaceae archaeon]|nr:aldehyde dehydrogenase family protein [Methanoregulaceae archaeon]